MGNDVEACKLFHDDLLQVINGIFKTEKLESPSMDISDASGKGDNYLGKLYRVKGNGKHGKSISLIIKCALESKIIRENFPIEKLFQREIHAYSKMLPTLYSLQEDLPKKNKFYFTKHYASIAEVEKETLIIADLAIDGYKMYNRKNPFDKQHLELVIINLARFHATSFVLKQKNPKLFEQFSLNVSRQLEYSDGIKELIIIGKDKCLDIIESAEVRRRVEENLEDFMEKYSSYLNYEHGQPYNAICHGDCWINNCMFKYDDEKPVDVQFIDWQEVRLASPITDLAYMMFSCTDEQIRSDFYMKSLDLYYEILDMNITMMGCKTAVCYPLDVYKDQIKSTMPFGLISSIVLLPTILSNNENVPDLDIKPEDIDIDSFNNLLCKRTRDRLNGVFKDMILFDLI